jgi:hypothetical protein
VRISPSVIQLVDHGRRGGDQVQVVLALEPLLDDLHVQHAEESRNGNQTQRDRGLGLELQRRIVELELVERLAQVRVIDWNRPGRYRRKRAAGAA